jgi:hypothetical protein
MMSKRRKILSGVLIVFLILGIGTAVKRTPKSTQNKPAVYASQAILTGDEDAEIANIAINAPEKGEVGELIRLDVSESTAESYKWILVPDCIDFQVYDDGEKAVFSARKPGEYMFIVACACQGTVDVKTHVITIEGYNPGPIPPDDNPPDIPQPDVNASLLQWIPYWCAQQKRPYSEALQLAASFESVASIIASGVPMTAEEIIASTSKSNKQALGDEIENWKPVLIEIQSVLKTRAMAGTLVTPEEHIATWREIAQGLRAYVASFADKPVLRGK